MATVSHTPTKWTNGALRRHRKQARRLAADGIDAWSGLGEIQMQQRGTIDTMRLQNAETIDESRDAARGERTGEKPNSQISS